MSAGRYPRHEQPQPQPGGEPHDPEQRGRAPRRLHRVPAVRAQPRRGGQDVRARPGRAGADGRAHPVHTAEHGDTVTRTAQAQLTFLFLLICNGLFNIIIISVHACHHCM